MLDTERHSTRIADSLPLSLVEFRGVEQSQGDWDYCVSLNTRLLRTLKPLEMNTRSSDEWDRFKILQRYTDGEAFFLCYPAAVIFGLLRKIGKVDLSDRFPWTSHYLNSQAIAAGIDTTVERVDPSTSFARKVRDSYAVEDHEFREASQLLSLLKTPTTLQDGSICLVQVACAYPMCGNKLFGHYVAVTEYDEPDEVTIAGGLGPFGIYESPYATVNLGELATFAAISTNIQHSQRKDTNLNIRDTLVGGGFEAIVIKPK